MDPAEQGYGNGILKLPLDLSRVEDYFIPANGVFLDNVRPCTLSVAAPAKSVLVVPLENRSRGC